MHIRVAIGQSAVSFCWKEELPYTDLIDLGFSSLAQGRSQEEVGLGFLQQRQGSKLHVKEAVLKLGGRSYSLKLVGVRSRKVMSKGLTCYLEKDLT